MLQPLPYSLPLPQGFSQPTLRAGQAVQTRVQTAQNDLFLMLGNSKVPLEPASLTPGQLVRVELTQTPEGPRLQVTPQPEPSQGLPPQSAQPAPGGATGPGAPPAALTQFVSNVMQTLDAAQVPAAASLLPSSLPQSADAIRNLLALFISRGTLSLDLQDLGAMLQQAAQEGRLSPQTLAAFQSLGGQLVGMESKDLEKLLHQLSSGRSLEARLAAAVQAGQSNGLMDDLHQNLRAMVSELRGREALIAYFRGKGTIRTFERTTQQVMDRLSGTDLQNLRGHDQGYLFWELPLPPDAALKHAQLHIFEDGQRRQKFSAHGATVVFDLQTTRLGDLWISLQTTPARLQINFRATSAEAREALREGAEELRGMLQEAGYVNAQVHTEHWDGDRLRAAANLMARFRGLEINA